MQIGNFISEATNGYSLGIHAVIGDIVAIGMCSDLTRAEVVGSTAFVQFDLTAQIKIRVSDVPRTTPFGS
jgi:hypothetical protein